ncbi:glycosyl transferase [Agrococcus sp. SL85]|uniref:glycosyl transferase n=1 Tax=Agrococcus sp. SL85 TaxID=2995141 RepID=UPI00226CEA00|nr:glycosyl transferase [Agrococcus sp. SL85]WAC65571.1 glycosyl transferase [Agrococcus sp. SL85]
MTSSAPRPIRVMQSFAAVRPTTNPYLHMLDAALAATPGVEHLRLDRRRALLGRYDALHLHWPETLLGGSTPSRALARRAFALALRIRLSITPVALVRTAHNLGLPEGARGWDRRFLAWVERRADHRILLNSHTPVPEGSGATLIPHGHYVDWFAPMPQAAAEPGLLAYVGLIRPYKGVEGLLDAFAATGAEGGALRLRVAGSPTSPAIEREVRGRAAADPRVELDLRYLTEADFADTVTRSSGVVLPYRAMHNSGSVLAALSLRRPVLVPAGPVVEALADEVGPGWIRTFEGDLAADDLLRFAEAAASPPASPPDLSARDWRDAGVAHREAFRAAVAHRRAAR